jgi:1,4-dihydroxy-2-naphthoate octaprenyltransferase
VFVFFGLVATTGTAYVQAEEIPLLTAVASVPVGLLATALLVVNNLRDVDTDAAAGKRTLAVRLGAQRTRRLFTALVLGAVAFVFLLVDMVEYSWRGAAMLVIVFPAYRLVRDVKRGSGAELVRSLGETAALHLAFGIVGTVALWR